MVPPRGMHLDDFRRLIPAVIARVRGWTAKQRWSKAEKHVLMMSDAGSAFIFCDWPREYDLDECLTVIACATFSPRGVPCIGMVFQADVEGCQTCKHGVTHGGYLQCGNPGYNLTEGTLNPLGKRIQRWQDDMYEHDAFDASGQLDAERAANYQCPGWDER